MYGGTPAEPVELSVHTDRQDTTSKAWLQLVALVDETAHKGLRDFIPARELGEDLWKQIVTLPANIARLDRVTGLHLYGSNLRSIPPAIGNMVSLQFFEPYRSHRLHWYPYEIVHCTELFDSVVSTKAVYGNRKNRLSFPRLPAALPEEAVPNRCSVCRTNGPSAELEPWWVSLLVATDVLALLAHVCSQKCLRMLGTPPEHYVSGPHQGGPELRRA